MSKSFSLSKKHAFATNERNQRGIFEEDTKIEKKKKKKRKEARKEGKKELKMDEKNRYLWQPN